MTNNVTVQLEKFVTATLTLSRQQQKPLLTPFDSDWPSPCYQTKGEEQEPVPWQPVLQQSECAFGNLEQALEMTLNEQFCLFFTHYYSNNLRAEAPQGGCELLQVWNKSDFERLQENLIGHVLMKRRLNHPPTLFFALTDEEDFILSVDNASGEVVLEQVGKRPCKPVAADLASFLQTLSPAI